MADTSIKSSTVDNGTEGSRTHSEKTSETKITDVDRQTNDVLSLGKEASSSIPSSLEMNIGNRLSVPGGDPRNRSGSSGSNPEHKFDTQDESKYKGMVKDHYISTGSRSHCRQCNKKFSVNLRPHHCRRCGEIHCMKCLRYKRKLNRLANFDPNGIPRKVCEKCFNEEDDTIGGIRRLTDDFCKERKLCKHERILQQRAVSLTDTFWRDQLDMEKECTRLLDGFSTAVGTSEAKRTLHEIQELVKPPKWQKSSFWKVEKKAENCRSCKGGLGIRKKKRNCKVCGLALCRKCSNKELLLYVEDEKEDDKRNQTKLGIIRVSGCPEKEPDISLLLHVCTDCKEYLVRQQTTAPPPSSFLKTLIIMDGDFTELQDRIARVNSQYEKMIDSAEIGEIQTSDLHVFTDYLQQLDTDLDTFERLFQSLRSLEKMASKTRVQTTLFKNYLAAKYEFYMDNRHAYRKLKNGQKTEVDNKMIVNKETQPFNDSKENDEFSQDNKKEIVAETSETQKGPNLDRNNYDNRLHDNNLSHTSATDPTITESGTDTDIVIEKKAPKISFIKRKFTSTKAKSGSLTNLNDKEEIPSEKPDENISSTQSKQTTGGDTQKLESPMSSIDSVTKLEIKTSDNNKVDRSKPLTNRPPEGNNIIETTRKSGEVSITKGLALWKR